MKLSNEIIYETVELIESKYDFPTQFINKMLTSFKLGGCGAIINRDFSKREKLKLVFNSQGSSIFAGSNDINKEIRRRILDKWPEDEVNTCFKKWCKSSGESRAHKVRKLSELKWHSGKNWANTFVDKSGFHHLFSGIANDEISKSKFEDIEPIIRPPQLMDFQIELKNALINTLNEKGDEAKCVISLPTGGGKTRTAVEAFVEWLQPRFAEGKYLIWMAQSEELCEQAIASISQVWSSKEFTDSLRVYRYFGNYRLNIEDFNGGVVVCTINKIYYDIENKGDISMEIVKNCGALIIDEAHRGISPMYQTLYEFSSELNGEAMFPICGLTATPGRNGTTDMLSSFFKSRLYTPTLGVEYDNNPIKYFRDKGYLARPKHVKIDTNYRIHHIDIDGDENSNDIKDELETYFKRKLLKSLADDTNRNVQIVQLLKDIKKGEPTLVYACTVGHAQLLSTIMNHLNRSSVFISSETRKPLRRKYIEQFKNGEIDFIFNYGVLTTGFDAPKTENIVICRPTFSDVLYEQIVGRGLRGPKFGGTTFCTIYDFCDNYDRFGDQLAYKRFESFWNV